MDDVRRNVRVIDLEGQRLRDAVPSREEPGGRVEAAGEFCRVDEVGFTPRDYRTAFAAGQRVQAKRARTTNDREARRK